MDLNELYNQCSTCAKCSLSDTRTHCVFGTGNINTKLMFVGEAPGEKEDLLGEPFVGASGKLFDKYLGAVGIDRSDVYITNILKCRPPKNRDPMSTEQDMCIDYLREQVKLIKPKFIVCLGRISAARLINPNFKITQEHGKWFEKGDYKMSAFYHPSALLRDPSKKQAMLDDMKLLKEMLDNLEDTEK